MPATTAGGGFRTLHLTNPLQSGPEVVHAQRLLAGSPFGDFRPGAVDGVFGPASAQAVRRAKLALGYPERAADESFGPVLLAYLEGTRPLHTDCSGFVTLCHRWAGAPDPNGRKFDGQGYTGTILQACRQIALGAVQPGDLVVWGAPPGHHVALVLEADLDPLLVSHGSERGPYAVRFSEACTWQPAPATWLTCLP